MARDKARVLWSDTGDVAISQVNHELLNEFESHEDFEVER